MALILKINNYPVTSPFGSIDPAHPIPHKGLDIGVPLGTPVRSIGDGVVTQLTDEGAQSFGKAVHVHMNNGTDVIYGHLSQFQSYVGEKVHAGDTLALSGSTGDSTGPHVHIQLMQHNTPIDPTPYLQLSSVPNSDDPVGFKDMIEKMFGIPHSLVDTSVQNPLAHELAQVFQQAASAFMHEIGIWLLRISPSIGEIVCMASVIGIMIGSERCKKLFPTSALATMILTVLNRVVG